MEKFSEDSREASWEQNVGAGWAGWPDETWGGGPGAGLRR